MMSSPKHPQESSSSFIRRPHGLALPGEYENFNTRLSPTEFRPLHVFPSLSELPVGCYSYLRLGAGADIYNQARRINRPPGGGAGHCFSIVSKLIEVTRRLGERCPSSSSALRGPGHRSQELYALWPDQEMMLCDSKKLVRNRSHRAGEQRRSASWPASTSLNGMNTYCPDSRGLRVRRLFSNEHKLVLAPRAARASELG